MEPITKEIWEADVENTRKECDAYLRIAKGFEILAQLPENRESGKSDEYSLLDLRYNTLHAQCCNALEKIIQYGIDERFNEAGVKD